MSMKMQILVPSLLVIGVLAFSGCGSPGASSSQVSNQQSEAQGEPPEEDPTSESSEAAVAALGDTISFGSNQRTTLEVTVDDVVVPLRTDDALETPEPGNQFVGVQITMTAVEESYNGMPSVGASLVDSSGAAHESEVLVTGECADVAQETRISPGDSRRVCIPFQIPEDTDPDKFQLSLNPSSDAFAEWTLSK